MFDKVVGQELLKQELTAIANGLIAEPNKSMNILLRGPGGCGKTFLAKEFATKVGDVYAFQIPIHQFLMSDNIIGIRCHVVDEIHVLKRPEDVYPYMDDGRHVFLFCTTNSGILPEPFTSRCLTYTFDDYTTQELMTITERYAHELTFPITPATSIIIAMRSRGSPRVAKKYIDRLYFMITQGRYPKTVKGIKGAFNDMGVFDGGFTSLDRKYIEFLSKVDHSSLGMIAASTDLDKNTITENIEPFLLERRLISISSKGRQFIGLQGGKRDGG